MILQFVLYFFTFFSYNDFRTFIANGATSALFEMDSFARIYIDFLFTFRAFLAVSAVKKNDARVAQIQISRAELFGH